MDSELFIKERHRDVADDIDMYQDEIYEVASEGENPEEKVTEEIPYENGSQ
jgi:hypothetical protein